MSRIQLALNVSDLNEAIDFYSKFFRTEPAKVRPGYANFAIDEPPLKLVLFERGGVPGSINHLGVEVSSADEVSEAVRYLSSIGMATRVEAATTCCFAIQDKVWVEGVDDSPWEVYTVLGEPPMSDCVDGDACCSSSSVEAGASPSAATACC